MTLILQKPRHPRRRIRLAGPNKTNNQNTPLILEVKRREITYEQRSQLVMEDFYDLLTGRDAAENSFAERFCFYPPDEFSGDLKIYIRFEQRQAHLTQRGVHVRFADNAVPTQILENFLKLVAKLWKHAVVSAA